MTFIPTHRPPGVGEGDSRVADIAAARLLASSMHDLGQSVPPWVALLALGMTAPSPADEVDLLSGLTRGMRKEAFGIKKESSRRHRRWFTRVFGYQLEVAPGVSQIKPAGTPPNRTFTRTNRLLKDEDGRTNSGADSPTGPVGEDPARPDPGSAGRR